MLFSFVFFFFKFVHEAYQKHFALDRTDYVVLALVLLSPIAEHILFYRNFKAATVETFEPFILFFLPYYFSKYFIKTRNDFDKIFMGLTLAAILSSVIAIVEYLAERSLYENFLTSLVLDPNEAFNNSSLIYYRAGVVRVAGAFSQPIFLGEFLLLVSLINILLIDNNYYEYKLRMFSYLQILLAILGAVLSQSRTGIMSFALCMFAYLLFSRKRLSYILIFSVFVLASYLVFTSYFPDTFSTIVFANVKEQGGIENLNGRIAVASATLLSLTGQINYLGELSPFYRNFVIAHNIDLINGILNKALLKGLVIALIYLFLWFKIFARNVQRFKRNSFNKIFLFIFVYLFIVDNITLLTYQNEMFFYILVGLQFNAFATNQENPLFANSYRDETRKYIIHPQAGG